MGATIRSRSAGSLGTPADKSLVGPGDYTMRYAVLNNNKTGDVVVVNEPNEFGTSRIEHHLIKNGFVVFATEPALQVEVEQSIGSQFGTSRRLAINRSLPDFAHTREEVSATTESYFDPVFLPTLPSHDITMRIVGRERAVFLSDPDEFF